MTDDETTAAALKEGADLVSACIKKAGALTGILVHENALMAWGAMMLDPNYAAARVKIRGLGHTERDLMLVETAAKATWEAKAT